MSLKPKIPGEPTAPYDPRCLETQEVPAVCLRLQSHRLRLAIPYALLLRLELSEDEAACEITFATHEVIVHGRHLRGVYLAVSKAKATQLSITPASHLGHGSAFLGSLITDIKIDALDDSTRTRR